MVNILCRRLRAAIGGVRDRRVPEAAMVDAAIHQHQGVPAAIAR